MALKLVDTKAVHEIDVDGTKIRARAFKWYQEANWTQIIRKFSVPTVGKVKGPDGSDIELDFRELNVRITDEDSRMVIDMLVDRIESIEGFDNVRETVEMMPMLDIYTVGAKIAALSRLNEEEVKN